MSVWGVVLFGMGYAVQTAFSCGLANCCSWGLGLCHEHNLSIETFRYHTKRDSTHARSPHSPHLVGHCGRCAWLVISFLFFPVWVVRVLTALPYFRCYFSKSPRVSIEFPMRLHRTLSLLPNVDFPQVLQQLPQRLQEAPVQVQRQEVPDPGGCQPYPASLPPQEEEERLREHGNVGGKRCLRCGKCGYVNAEAEGKESKRLRRNRFY